VSDNLVQIVDQQIRQRRRFTISELSCGFPQISRNLLYHIIRVTLRCHVFWARWLPKMLIAPAFTFLQRYHIDGDKFLNHMLRVTGDEAWVSFVNVETKEQSKQ
jgi:hypothetical protein